MDDILFLQEFPDVINFFRGIIQYSPIFTMLQFNFYVLLIFAIVKRSAHKGGD